MCDPWTDLVKNMPELYTQQPLLPNLLKQYVL